MRHEKEAFVAWDSLRAPRRVGESPHDMILNASRSSCSTVVYLCEGWSRAAMMKRDVAEVRSEGGPLQLDEEDMVVAIPADANNVWN
jgi:hypothetical protein